MDLKGSLFLSSALHTLGRHHSRGEFHNPHQRVLWQVPPRIPVRQVWSTWLVMEASEELIGLDEDDEGIGMVQELDHLLWNGLKTTNTISVQRLRWGVSWTWASGSFNCRRSLCLGLPAFWSVTHLVSGIHKLCIFVYQAPTGAWLVGAKNVRNLVVWRI